MIVLVLYWLKSLFSKNKDDLDTCIENIFVKM